MRTAGQGGNEQTIAQQQTGQITTKYKTSAASIQYIKNTSSCSRASCDIQQAHRVELSRLIVPPISARDSTQEHTVY